MGEYLVRINSQQDSMVKGAVESVPYMKEWW